MLFNVGEFRGHDTELPKMEKAINRLIVSITKTVSELTALKGVRLLWHEAERRIGRMIAETWIKE